MKRNKRVVDRMKNELSIRCKALYELLDKEPIKDSKIDFSESDEALDNYYQEVSINSTLVRIAADDLSTIIKEIRKL